MFAWVNFYTSHKQKKKGRFMKKYEDYDIDVVSDKYIFARADKSEIIKYSIIGFVIGISFVLFICFIGSVTLDWSIILACVIAGLICSGFPYAYSQMESFGGILWFIRFFASLFFGIPITLLAFIWKTIVIHKYKPIIEEDQKRNPELYMEVADTVKLLIGDNKDVSHQYVTEEVIKYRDWLYKHQITRNEYIQFIRGIVKV